MIKKIISLVAAVSIISSFTVANAEKIASAVNDDNKYVTVSGEDCVMRDYSNDRKSPYTKDSDNINFVSILNGVTRIGNNTFKSCTELGDAVMSSTMETIGAQAFANCKSLKKMVIPSGVTEIERYAFIDCVCMESVYVPDTVTKIGESAFYNCPNLTVYCGENSSMKTYAINNGLKYVISNGRHNRKVDVLDTIKIIVNNTKLNYTHPVIMKDNVTLIPLRCIFEAVGATVGWNSETRCATVDKDSTHLEFLIDSDSVVKNGSTEALSTETELICGDTMVAVRAVEKLGMKVTWDGTTQTITINN